MKHKYNWKPDLPDHRDNKYLQFALPNMPSHVDLRTCCSAVCDQGQIGSCSGNALAGHIEFLELKNKSEDLGQNVFANASRLFIYWNERDIEGTTGYDAGARLKDGIQSLAKIGVCSEVMWAYSESNLLVKPDKLAYMVAQNHRISSYSRIEGLAGMKHCLASGYPFVFGFTVYESFESQAVAESGYVPMPNLGEQCMGGHAVMAVGYDDSERMIIVRNSWGPQWALGGYFKMPYEYISNPDLAADFWTIRK